jgi:ribose 5-phosphate isomerase B
MHPVNEDPSDLEALVRHSPEVWLVSTPYHPLARRRGLEEALDSLLSRGETVEFRRRLGASTVRVVRYRAGGAQRSAGLCPAGHRLRGEASGEAKAPHRLRVIIASDHGGLALKSELVPFLQSQGYDVNDYGVHSADPVDYPDVALLVAHAVATDPAGAVGIILDGAGTGSAITANKVPGIRAAACYDTFTARNSREHNDANVLTLGGRVTGVELAKEICRTWLAASFAGQRHARRVEKVLQVERRFLKEPV